ncbi:MAG: RagB/SusD family nutrient uptake outer membrane protein [Cyclobacteriaceae bacterium]|nr:RagB/SusD family nutrient uptake outer membrane protein [Cyclobacteriaceae bacterium]
MKKVNKFFTILLAVTFITSCDLDIKPVDSVVEEDALTDAASVQALLVGAYDRLSDENLYGGWIQMNSDLLGTNLDITWGGTFSEPDDIWQKVITVNNAQVELTWSKAYEAINVANIVLANLNLADNDPVIEGEAKFIRATVYFELVRLFAKDWADGNPTVNLGVPLKLEPTNLVYNPSANFISRNTVQEVYTQILADLQDAEANLPDDNGFFATSWAAKAMLARVHLQRREYNLARIKANEVIESGVFSLADRVDRCFNLENNSDEDIFAIQVTDQDGVNALHTFYASRSLNGRRDIRIRQEFMDLFDPSDERLTRLIYPDGSTRNLSGKYQNQFANISIIRLAEMYLIRAEGNLVAGGTQEGPNTPGEDLQVLRDRAKAPNAPVSPTIADILLERKYELAFEGHFIHDIRRNEITIDQFGPILWNADELVFPIPQREMDANPALSGQQNSGY